MSKYEIDLLINGKLDKKQASALADSLTKSIAKCDNYELDAWGLRELAYKIKGCEAAYYYIYYFDCDDAKVINEFRRLSNLNADVLRILIINLEKTYGYSMVNNPKKIKQANLRYDNYSKKVAAFEAEFTKKRNSRLNVEDTSHIVDEEIIDTDE